MPEPLTIVIPMGGHGTRMRPQTWSKPKPLVSVAGKPALEHLLDMFAGIPGIERSEYVFIVSPFLGASQIPRFISEAHPHLKVRYVVQDEMKGQSHALWLAREHLQGPALICFSDTLMDADLSFLADEPADGVVWAKLVEDPRRFGVAELGPDSWVRSFIEKPATMENKLAVVGCYYFRRAEALLSAIEEQMDRDVSQGGEYFLADAISIMIAHGAKVRIEEVRAWLDTGTPEATLETNRWLLDRKRFDMVPRAGVTIIPPVAIHPTARITDSTIGPYASIGANCSIWGSRVEASILEPGAELQNVSLLDSLVGSRASVCGKGSEQKLKLNVGDDCNIVIE